RGSHRYAAGSALLQARRDFAIRAAAIAGGEVTPEHAMKTLSLRLPDALAAKLSAAARKRQVSKSLLVREALRAYLSNSGRPQPRSFLNLASDLIGSLHDGPGDLA